MKSVVVIFIVFEMSMIINIVHSFCPEVCKEVNTVDECFVCAHNIDNKISGSLTGELCTIQTKGNAIEECEKNAKKLKDCNIELIEAKGDQGCFIKFYQMQCNPGYEACHATNSTMMCDECASKFTDKRKKRSTFTKGMCRFEFKGQTQEVCNNLTKPIYGCKCFSEAKFKSGVCKVQISNNC